jgi:hypothetical protein
MDKIIIRSTPKVTPTKMSVPDLDGTTNKDGNRISSTETGGEGQAVKRGSSTPIVQIGGLRLPEDMVKSMTVWQDGLLPKISLTILDVDGVFGSGIFPIADPLISIFVRSTNGKLKSLGGDYLTASVGSVPIPNSDLTLYTFVGELHVPKINGNFSRSYKNMTSLEALQKVADELQLGFADNQPQNTNDRMTWLMPNYTYKEFINDVKKIAYSSDDNFFDCFIDRYYNLNLINVEKMLAQEPEIEKGLLALEQGAIDQRRVSESPETTENDIEAKIILTNHPGSNGSEFYIKEYTLSSNHGEILANHALRTHVYWYQHGANTDQAKSDDINYRDHYLEPIQTPKQNNGKEPQTVNLDEFRNAETVAGSWTGIDYSNAHRDYKFAAELNEHNLLEIKKNTLRVRLDGININVLRGSRVAVLIYMTQTAARAAAASRAKVGEAENAVENIDPEANFSSTESPPRLIADKSLSGFYYVSSITYSYSNNAFETEMVLAKRDWLLPRPKNDVKF